VAWKHFLGKIPGDLALAEGTVVSLPHCEQLVLFLRVETEIPSTAASVRFALATRAALRLFLIPCRAKNICSREEKQNSAPHSEHFSTLSMDSMTPSPWTPIGRGRGLHGGLMKRVGLCVGNAGRGSLGPAGIRFRTNTNLSADRVA